MDPLDLLTNDGNNAKMTSEGLPADRISLENGSIITSCKRWPLIIDPQQQVTEVFASFHNLWRAFGNADDDISERRISE